MNYNNYDYIMLNLGEMISDGCKSNGTWLLNRSEGFQKIKKRILYTRNPESLMIN